MNIELLIKYFSGQALPEEAMQVHEWKSINAENLNIYNHLLQTWHPDYNYHKDKTFIKMWQSLHTPTVSKASKLWLWISMAAALILLITLRGYFWSNIDVLEEKYFYSAAQPEIILPDSNQVTLYPGATLTFLQQNDSTLLTCIGDMEFNIEHHKSTLKFTIGYDIFIHDIGTIFKLRHSSNQVDIEVLEGQLIVTRYQEQYQVIKNNILTFNIAQQTFEQQKRSLNLHWDNKNLKSATDELENYFHVKIQLKEDSLALKKITFIAEKVSLEDILKIISETLSVNYSIQNDEILIY